MVIKDIFGGFIPEEINGELLFELNKKSRKLDEINRSPQATIETSLCSIVPWLTVPNATRAVEFYKSAFGAIEVYHLEDPSGSVVSRLAIDAAGFCLSDDPEALGNGSVRMILTVVNPETGCGQALASGATEIFPVGESYGWRLEHGLIHSDITGRSVVHSNSSWGMKEK
jgi:PhnB protein